MKNKIFLIMIIFVSSAIFAEISDSVISVSNENIIENDSFTIEISTSFLEPEWDITACQFELHFNSSLIAYTGYSLENTIFDGFMIAINSNNDGYIICGIIGTNEAVGSGSLININFIANAIGETDLILNDFLYNTVQIENLVNGHVSIGSAIIDNKNKVQKGNYILNFCPNPFNISKRNSRKVSHFNYNIAKNNSVVDFKIYNIRGKLIKNIFEGKKEKGLYQSFWDGSDLQKRYVASGLYLLKAKIGNDIFIKKISLIK